MKLKLLILIIFSISILTCQEEEIKPQIEEEKLIKILTDLHFSEAAILSLNQKIKDSISNIYYEQIFEIHGVADSVFYSDLEILRKDAKRLEEIYQKVMVEIEQINVIKLESDSIEVSTKKNK